MTALSSKHYSGHCRAAEEEDDPGTLRTETWSTDGHGSIFCVPVQPNPSKSEKLDPTQPPSNPWVRPTNGHVSAIQKAT